MISPENSVFITGGAGGVGTMLIKLLLAHGINTFITTVGNKESRSHLLDLGVKSEQIVNYRTEDLEQTILALNNHQLFDITIDLVGGTMSELCSQLLKVNGAYADITNFTTSKACEQLFDKGITIYNISNYAYGLSGSTSQLSYYGKKLDFLMHLIGAKKITTPPILLMGDLSVESVKQAHTLLENNQTKGKKVVMKVK